MGRKRARKSEYGIEWWERWLNADNPEREKLVAKLPFTRDCIECKWLKMPRELREHTIPGLLNSFFEDLESAVYTKVDLETKKRKRGNKAV